MDAWIGLVGVVVGAVITAGFQWIKERRNARNERALAARLVGSEIGTAISAFNHAAMTRDWWPGDLSTASWEKHASSLSTLSLLDWTGIEGAYDAIGRGARTRAVASGRAPNAAEIVDMVAEIPTMRAALPLLAPHVEMTKFWHWGVRRAARKYRAEAREVVWEKLMAQGSAAPTPAPPAPPPDPPASDAPPPRPGPD